MCQPTGRHAETGIGYRARKKNIGIEYHIGGQMFPFIDFRTELPFYIAEVPIGVCCFDMYDGQKLWSFTGKGEYVAHKSVSSLEDINGNHEIFWGREEADCRFKVGDVVEMHCGKYSELGMICRMPIDYEFAKKNLPTEKPAEPLTYHIDYSDDMYQVVSIYSEYIDYVDVINCFPPETLPLDESLVRKLKEKSAELN